MQKRDLIQANASLENLRQNLDMKDFAKEILLEENYNKFIRSYKFTFWFQLIGVLAGFIVPSVVLLVIFKEFIYCAFGATIGIFWMCVWMLLSMVIPPTDCFHRRSYLFMLSHFHFSDMVVFLTHQPFIIQKSSNIHFFCHNPFHGIFR